MGFWQRRAQERAQRRAQQRWVRDMERRLADLDAFDPSAFEAGGAGPTHGELYRSGGPVPMPAGPSGARRPRRTHGPVLPGLLVALVLASLVVLRDPGATGDRVRELVGGNQRLAEIVGIGDGEGAYEFVRMQPRGQGPVTWSPCKPIPYVVNPDGAPAVWAELVEESIADVEEASGFVFDDQGQTDDRDFDQRSVAAGRASPVLIGWSDADETPALAGDVAGLGGSAWQSRQVGPEWFVAGMIALDTDTFDRLAGQRGGEQAMRAIITHELGHVLGLGHVDDDTQLMYGGNLVRSELGAGDLEGLARLGAVDC
ncbi:hypothetical protein I601_0406 [Nocardioides dokdonensis FR1436]|uniref:Peptidase M10 metallopeptidase domain-containing protein n=1 Tax=Nocardioides dokdonensis FR1436 TaxID=1300347 RepID=A0A1A9GF11_9ACTN|nr:matrixin family metalloprotease [Nocardioides dokdonensis]ANH36858.1 hypothetical protein I601_0406 [Nocardioides dokdonensis FR1436]